MPKAMQVLTGFVTAPSTTQTAWTMASGDSLSVRSTPEGQPIHMLNMWADNQAAGTLRVRSPMLHDNVVGITAGVVASEVMPLMPMGLGQVLRPQDLLIVEQTGSAVAGDIESGSLLLYYDDLPGANARLFTYAQIVSQIESYMYTSHTLATGTAGGYSGEVVLTTGNAQWKANRDYALLGYYCSVECCTIGVRGPDTSNLRVAGPGNEVQRDITGNWFISLSMMTGKPCIPVINAANAPSTLIDGVQDENGTDVVVNLVLALLRG